MTMQNAARQTGYSSEDLYEDCLRGDSNAWDAAARYVGGILSRSCWDLCEEERNDLVNETLLYFLSRGLGEIEEPRAFRKLLKLKAKCLALDHRRRTAGITFVDPPRAGEDDDAPPIEYFPPSRDESEQKIFTNQALKICSLIIDSLKKECREILPLYFRYKVVGDGVGRLAEDQGKPLGSIAVSVHRCLKKLYSHPQIVMLKEEFLGGSG